MEKRGTFLLVLLTGGVVARCPDDQWTEFDRHCYIAVRRHINFSLAQDSCNKMGANLTSIHSEVEHTFLAAMSTGQADNNFWVGLRRKDGVYRWSDGTTLGTWASWQVQLRNNAECGAMAGAWIVTRPCHYYYYYICQKPTEITTTATPTSTSTTTTTTTTTPTSATTTTIIPTSTSTSTTTFTSTTTVPTTTITTTTSTTTPSPTTTMFVATTTKKSPANTMESLVWVRKKSEMASIPDNRPSAVGIGAFGVFIMVAILVCVFLMDIGTFVKHFRWMRRNLKQFCNRKKDREVLCDSEDGRF